MIIIKVFIMNGRGSSGKTTIENMIVEIAAAHGKKIEILSTIDYVKEVAKGFGWDGSKEPKDRKMLSDLKDILTEWNDLPYKIVCDKIENLMCSGVTAVFVDCREPAEIKRFVEEYNALTVLVKRSSISMIYGNHADDNVEDYEYDCVIDNSRGLMELLDEANIFYEVFIEENEKE